MCSWSAIFLCVYTGQIRFAALGSQGVTTKEAQDGCSQDERKSPQDSEELSAPPSGIISVEPCSPKSIYCLADKVCHVPVPLRSDAVTDGSFD
jgi:hypothetical protein